MHLSVTSWLLGVAAFKLFAFRQLLGLRDKVLTKDLMVQRPPAASK